MIRDRIRMAGVSLLEVLVSIVVLSIGLLGVAGMQYQGSDSTSSAYLRSQATLIANETAERMHANHLAADTNDYRDINIINLKDYTDNTVLNAYCDSQASVTASSCSISEMALFDIYQMVEAIQSLLPSGSLSIRCDDIDTLDVDVCTDGSDHYINVSWSDKGNGKAIASNVEIKVTP